MTPGLAESLARLAEATPRLQDPWWLIGSAAMVLHGAGPISVADVDILATPRDAHTLADLWGVAVTPSAPNPRFRSEVYFQWTLPPVPVDVMAGFQVMTPDGWLPLTPATRVPVATPGGANVFTPALDEQIAILELFGREKDLERVKLLRALRPSSTYG